MKLRNRTIEPEFWQNRKLAGLPAHCRLLYIALWQLADREGRLKNESEVIKGMVFPFEKIDIEKLVGHLRKSEFVATYGPNGDDYIVIIEFKRHQKVHPNEAQSIIPAPPDDVIKCNLMSLNAITSDSSVEVEVKKEVKEEEERQTEIEQIISDLNGLLGSKYSPATKSIRSDIRARLREGFTVADFLHVHRVKVAEWRGTEREIYIRPKTLYNATNFPNYVNQREVKPKPTVEMSEVERHIAAFNQKSKRPVDA